MDAATGGGAAALFAIGWRDCNGGDAGGARLVFLAAGRAGYRPEQSLGAAECLTTHEHRHGWVATVTR